MTEPLLEHAAAARGPLRPYALALVGLDTAAGWIIVAMISRDGGGRVRRRCCCAMC